MSLPHDATVGLQSSVHTHFPFDSNLFFADIFDNPCFQNPSNNVHAGVFCTASKQINIMCGYRVIRVHAVLVMCLLYAFKMV